MLKGKKAVEWYILAALIFLAASIIIIVLWQTGTLSKIGQIASQAFFGPLE